MKPHSTTAKHNNSLDRSGGGVFRIERGAAEVEWNAPPGQLRRWVSFLMFRTLAKLAILLGAVALALPQDANDGALVKSNGWNTGALRLLKTKSQSEMLVGAANVNVSVLVMPEEGILFEDTAYYLNINGNRTLHPSPMNAYSASKFDVNGNVFAYTVRGPGVAIARISKTQKRVAALACESFFAFYDRDGDGKFETLVHLGDNGPLNLNVPSWARR